MKNFNFKAFFIAIVAPFVKLFPSWALKFTKKANPFAEKFQLSSKKEIAYLLKHLPSDAWIGERIWHLQTRKYFYKNEDTQPELFEAFIKDINNSLLFDTAYEIAPEDAIKAKSYTLDAERVVKACNDDVNRLYILAEKQPQSFTVDLVRKLNANRQEAYFSYIFSKNMLEKLAELDVIFFKEAKKNDTARNCLAFLMYQREYKPNLYPEQLSSLGDKFDNWCKIANPRVVASKMADFWYRKQNFEAIFNLLQRTLKVEVVGYDTSYKLLSLLETSEYYAQALNLFLKDDIACPAGFKYLLDHHLEDDIEKNIALCIEQKVEGKIQEACFERFDDRQKKKVLIALAKDEKLSNKMLNKAPNDAIRSMLLDILEEKAQVKWFFPHTGYSPQSEDIKILENYFKNGQIYPDLQDLVFKNNDWVQLFIEKNWFDNAHKLKLMQSVFIADIKNFMQKYGITQAQFEALLTGRNANLAPEARLYLK